MEAEKNSVILTVISQSEGVPSDTFDGILLFTRYDCDYDHYVIMLELEQEGKKGPLLKINAELYNNLRVVARELQQHVPEGHVQLIEILHAFHDRVETFFDQGIDVQTEIQRNEFSQMVTQLAQILGNRRYFFDSPREMHGPFEYKFIGPALAICRLLKGTWAHSLLTQFSTLSGIVERYMCGKLPGPANFVTPNELQQLCIPANRELWPSNTYDFYIYDCTRYHFLGVSRNHVIKVTRFRAPYLRTCAFGGHEAITYTTPEQYASWAYNRRSLNNILDEEDTLSELKYESFAKLVGSCKTLTTFYHIFPLYNGTLEHHFLELSWLQTLKALKQAAHSIHLLHTHSPNHYVHADLKAENFCVNENGDLILIDMGSVAMRGDRDQGGTGAYRDPFLTKGPRLLDQQCDIHSLGMLMIRIISDIPMHSKVAGSVYVEINQKFGTGLKSNYIRAGLQNDCSDISARQTMELALSCLSEPRAERPRAYQVANRLNEIYVI